MSLSSAPDSPSTEHNEAISVNGSDKGMKSLAENTSINDEDEDGDDLFGADDDGEEEADDNHDDEGISAGRKSGLKKSKRANSQTSSADASSQQATNAVRADLAPPSPTPPPAPASPSGSSRSAKSYDALEHRELSAEPPMGVRETQAAAPTDIQEASFTLPSLPVRRGIPHHFARLPNMLQYRSEIFDEDTFDEKKEDDMLQSREGIRIDDEGLRSLLTTSNTIRWRWTNKVDEEGYRIPESNARIVKWSDGTSSLQLGSEFYDISQTTERSQATATAAVASSAGQQQPVQHLTHLFVKHVGQDEINMFQSETPIASSLTFRPTSTSSESHQRLAKAVRKQKGTLVKETVLREDPDLEKERLEKEEKKRGQKRMRELKRRNKNRDEDDDDAFWDSAAKSARRTGGRGVAIMAGDDATAGVGVGRYEDGEEDAEDDGFVVDDDLEDDEDGQGSVEEDMDVDKEPDEMELLEAKMEKQEALRKAGKANRDHHSTEADEDAVNGKKAGTSSSDDD